MWTVECYGRRRSGNDNCEYEQGRSHSRTTGGGPGERRLKQERPHRQRSPSHEQEEGQILDGYTPQTCYLCGLQNCVTAESCVELSYVSLGQRKLTGAFKPAITTHCLSYTCLGSYIYTSVFCLHCLQSHSAFFLKHISLKRTPLCCYRQVTDRPSPV